MVRKHQGPIVQINDKDISEEIEADYNQPPENQCNGKIFH